jgi:hypothetical protein
MISYIDTGVPPLSPAIVAQYEGMNGRLYTDDRAADQIGMWVNRTEHGTTVSVAFPNNPVARESIVRYVDAMKSAYVSVAEGSFASASFANMAQLLKPA